MSDAKEILEAIENESGLCSKEGCAEQTLPWLIDMCNQVIALQSIIEHISVLETKVNDLEFYKENKNCMACWGEIHHCGCGLADER